MLEKLLADFLHGVNIYLRTVCDQADHAVKFVSNCLFFVLYVCYKLVI